MKIKKRTRSALRAKENSVFLGNPKRLQLLPLLLFLFSTTNLLAQPANNSCSTAIALSCNNTINSNNQGASDDTIPTCGLVTPGQTVWYSLIGTGTNITISTCNPGTDFDSQIGIYTGSCGALTCVVGNNNDSSCTEDTHDATVSWNSTANETYYIVVAGVVGAEGNFELSVIRDPPSGSPPPSDPYNLCNDPVDINCVENTIIGNNKDGTDHTALSCNSITPTKVVWYRIAGINGEITASTCSANTNFDTELAIYTGACQPGGNFLCVDANDNDPSCSQDTLASTVTWESNAGEDYFIAVGGVSGAIGDFELSISKSFEECGIICIEADNFSSCMDNGTLNDGSDDTFTADITITFTNPPVPTNLVLEGDLLVNQETIPITDPAATVHTFNDVEFNTAISDNGNAVPLELSAAFSADPSCNFTEPSAGGSNHALFPCLEICIGPSNVGNAYPNCWPETNPVDECDDPINYAPDPDFPELTPLRYIKVVLHIMQREHPDSTKRGQWIPHPDDLCNFTKEDHIDLIKKWFTEPSGVNATMSNLCDDPTDFSPHMTDSRVRFLNEGIVADSLTLMPGEIPDVFFHPDDRGWGVGFFSCGNGLDQVSPYLSTLEDYVEDPNIAHPYYDYLIHPDIQNAFHVFITSGKWQVRDSLNDPNPKEPTLYDVPDADDCYWFGGGGSTPDAGCENMSTPSMPIQTGYGWFPSWQRFYNLPSCIQDENGMSVPGTIDAA